MGKDLQWKAVKGPKISSEEVQMKQLCRFSVIERPKDSTLTLIGGCFIDNHTTSSLSTCILINLI